jgi:glycosyltransferase involved in cell wall biosynthesis
MKVLLTSGIYPPDIGGPATFIPELAQLLVDKNHLVDIITLGKISAADKSNNWILHRITRDRKIIRIPKTIFKIYNESKDCNAIFANGLFIEVAFAIMLRRRKIKGVAKIVGDPVWERAVNNKSTDLSLIDFNYKKKFAIKFAIQRFVFNWAFSKFDTLICPSQELLEAVSRWLPNKEIKVIQNGTECQLFNDSRIKVTNYDVILVSWLVKWKNIDTVLKTFENSEFRIGIIGTGPEEVELKKLAKSKFMKVEFLGALSSEEVIKKLRVSKLFILYSSYEGLSYALIEAMAHGLAVVASDNKGNANVITDNIDGILVPLDNPGKLRVAVTELLKDDTKLIELGKNASLTTRSHYCKEAQLGKIIKEIQKIQVLK